MDIWKWYSDLYAQLQDTEHEAQMEVVDDISSFTCDDAHDKVDAIFPQTLDFSRKLGNPWLEVFVRHWHLQSQVLHRRNGLGMLSEAIDLLDFSSRDETKDCPQSICVVQDLASCYSATDGPGYVNEVLAVCEETLNRINPKWPCYSCIAEEQMVALNSAGDYQQALTLETKHAKALENVEQLNRTEKFGRQKALALIGLKRYKDALEVIEHTHNFAGGESFSRDCNLIKALCYAHLTDFEKGQEYILPFDQALKSQSYFVHWVEYYFLQAMGDETHNTAQLNSCFSTMTKLIHENGAMRDTITIANRQAQLAILRKDAFTLDKCIEIIELSIVHLNKDLGASALLGDLKVEHEKLSVAAFEYSLEQLHRMLDEEQDISLTQLHQAYAVYRDDWLINDVYAKKLAENGFVTEAKGVLEQGISQHGVNCPLLNTYYQCLLKSKQTDEFDCFVSQLEFEELSQESQLDTLRFKAVRYWTDDKALSLKAVQQFLQIEPQSRQMLHRAATLSIELADYQLSIEYYQQLIDPQDEDSLSLSWDLLVPATILQDWVLVRQASKALDIEFCTEQGPVDENWGAIRLQLDDEEQSIVHATRIGPVHAVVTHVNDIYDEQFLDDVVVFEPTPLNELNQTDEQGQAQDSEGNDTLLFEAVKTVKKGDLFYFTIDGVHPGEAQWSNFLTAIVDYSIKGAVLSNQHYRLDDAQQEGDCDLLGVYFVGAVTCQRDLSELKEVLLKLTDEFNYPLLFKELVEPLGDSQFEAQQLAIAQRFNL